MANWWIALQNKHTSDKKNLYLPIYKQKNFTTKKWKKNNLKRKNETKDCLIDSALSKSNL